jgi:hypothetical protein
MLNKYINRYFIDFYIELHPYKLVKIKSLNLYVRELSFEKLSFCILDFLIFGLAFSLTRPKPVVFKQRDYRNNLTERQFIGFNFTLSRYYLNTFFLNLISSQFVLKLSKKNILNKSFSYSMELPYFILRDSYYYVLIKYLTINFDLKISFQFLINNQSFLIFKCILASYLNNEFEQVLKSI